MIERIENLTYHSKFSFNGKIYVILSREGNMSEVKDETGKLWAWPSCAKVNPLAIPPRLFSNRN